VARVCPPALAAALSCLVLAGCGVQGNAGIDAPVNVYVSLPLTGPRAADGRDAADGARLALEQAQGEAGSIEVRAQYLDDAKGADWDPVTVGANARRAVQDSSAAAYIGELDSEPTRASVPITNDAGLVQVSPGAGGVDLTRAAAGYPDSPDRYQPSGSVSFARTVPADDLVAEAAAEAASEQGARRALVESDGSAYQDLMAMEFSAAANERGIEVPEQKRPVEDAVYQPGVQRLELAGTTPETLQLSAELDPGRLPGRQFANQFDARFHRPPGAYAAYGYEAMNLALQAIHRAGTDASSFRDKVRNGVIGARRDQSILGPYSITDDGDTTECMIQRYRVQGTALEPLGSSCPPR
jgi:branched-chain amino acid transport system substrate-binding protein